MLAVKEEKSHGERGEDETDKRDHDGRKECGREVLSNVAGVRGKFLSGEGGVDSEGKKNTGGGGDGWEDLSADGVHRGDIIGGLGHQLCSDNRRRRNGLEAVYSLEGENKGSQSSEEFHLDM